MPFKTDTNVPPYFNDMDELKQFHALLFRPKIAVQARELTQLQYILQNQIERFGSWAFKNGSIVSGCAIQTIPFFPYIRLDDFQSNGANFDAEDLVGKEVVCASTNLHARVLCANSGFKISYPDTNRIYVQYLNTGTGGQTEFANGQSLTFYNIPQTGNVTADTVASVNVYTSNANTVSVGTGYGITVSDGIVFLSGAFVKVQDPAVGIVNAYGSYAGNNVVGFSASESIITEDTDESLNDNSLGYSNENAPGAHRLKIVPTLVTLTQSEWANTSDFNPIAIFNYGSLISQTEQSSNVYSVLGEILKQRTFEESGNYVVNPFAADTVTSLLGNSVVSSLDANNFLGRISPGVGYALGARVELLKTAYINMRRGVDTDSAESQQITFNYGGYFLCDEVAGAFPFTTAANVYLYDAAQAAITDRQYSALTPTGNLIGTAKLRHAAYLSGTPGTNTAQYAIHVFDVKLSNGYSTANIASLYCNTGGVYGVADIISASTLGTANKDQLYSFGVRGLKNLRDAANNNNSQYTFRSRKTGTMAANGDITITIPSSATGGTDILPWGVGILPDVDADSFILTATANVDTANLAGTVQVYTSNAHVAGSSTNFATDFIPGATIKVGSDIRVVNTVINATAMTVDAAFSANASGQNYVRSFLQGQIIPISQSLNLNKVSYVNITNTTSFTIKTNLAPSTALAVDVTYDILRTEVSPATKAIKKNRFVKINTLTNPKGPWCLGFSDVHKINKIYGSASNTYTTSGSDVTANFVLDTGQKDTHYDLAYLYPKAGAAVASNPYLLVDLDYFAANTAGGLGFFTVESYPIDDANTANSAAIQTKDIPVYIDEAGEKTYLRDYIDFRTPSTPTANDTGNVVTSNSTQVTTAIGYASYNPSDALTLAIPAAGLNFPSYGRNFQADYTHYLGRKDLLMITPDGVLKVKEGVASTAPQTPLYPDNAMPLAVYNIPPYPSLTTDQLDAQSLINRGSRNLIRDVTSAISTSMVTNRRYTMRDVGKLDSRISNLEALARLSMLEKKAVDIKVTDAAGLDRFKNGVFVDAMNDFSICDVSNPEFSIAIDSQKSVARPRIVREIVKLDIANDFDTVNNANTGGRDFFVDTTRNIQKTGRCLTLPYNEVSFMVQPFATGYRTAAPVAFAWNGKLMLIPPYDNHNDDENTGSINITIDNTSAWKEFAASPMGSIWGDWRTTTTSVSNTVVTGSQDTYTIELGQFDWRGSIEESWSAAASRAYQLYGGVGVIGNLTLPGFGTRDI